MKRFVRQEISFTRYRYTHTQTHKLVECRKCIFCHEIVSNIGIYLAYNVKTRCVNIVDERNIHKVQFVLSHIHLKHFTTWT